MKILEIIIKIIAFPIVLFFVFAFAIIGIVVGNGIETAKMFTKDYLTLYY
jgi:hypothetical protein